MRKVIILLLFVILIFPVNVAANTVVPGETISSIDTKFKQINATAKQSKQVKQLVKQLQGPMSERKKRIVLTYSGTWFDVYDDFEEALLAVLLEDEYLAYDYRGYSYTAKEKKGKLTIEVMFNYYQTTNQHNYVKQQVKKIVAAKTTGAMSQHEKVKVLHDYVVANVKYDHSLNQRINAPYFALKGGKTLCNGYAMLMYMLLKEVGIDVRLASGSAGIGKNKEYHAWNIVKLDNTWYHLDPTWNDYDDGIIRYDYYLVSDANLKKDHSWKKGGLNGDEKAYPTAKVNYFDKILANQDEEALKLFDLWLDPNTTAYDEDELQTLLNYYINTLQPEFTLNYVGDDAYDIEENLALYIETAKDGLNFRYRLKTEIYNYANTIGLRIFVDPSNYSEDVADIWFDNNMAYGTTEKANVLMKRTDGAVFDISDLVTYTFNNETLATGHNGILQLNAPGETVVTFKYNNGSFNHTLTITGESPLQQAANAPYPFANFKSLHDGTIVGSNKQWVITTSKTMTKKKQPIVRVFDAAGNEQYVFVQIKGNKVIVKAPIGGYESGEEYRLFVHFANYPLQNRSVRFVVN